MDVWEKKADLITIQWSVVIPMKYCFHGAVTVVPHWIQQFENNYHSKWNNNSPARRSKFDEIPRYLSRIRLEQETGSTTRPSYLTKLNPYKLSADSIFTNGAENVTRRIYAAHNVPDGSSILRSYCSKLVNLGRNV